MSEAEASPWVSRTRWLAFALIAPVAMLRATAYHEPFPGWDTDPLLTPTISLGLGPAMVGVTDLLLVLGCLAAVVSCWVGRERMPMVALVGLIAGGVGVTLHGLVLAPGEGSPLTGSSRALAIGAGWVSAVAGGVGIWIAGRDQRVRAMALALGAGLAGAIAVQGVVQVYLEHPDTVRLYEETKDTFLASRGWAPGSPQALAYERRLSQPNVTGWFAMANPAATLLAAGLVALILAVSPHRGLKDNTGRGAIAVGLIAALALGWALWLTQSNAGRLLPVIGVGLALIPLGWRVRTRAFIVLPALLSLAVLARGVIGERVGELSVLFRSFYLEGAWNVWLSSPVFGVGPDGFQDAYLLVRGPLAVEEVSSPHHAPAAWIAGLGVFGLGLVVAVAAVLWGADAKEGNEKDLGVFSARGAAGLVALVGVVGMGFAWAGMTPEGLLSRLVGMGIWVGIAWVVWAAWSLERGRREIGAGILGALVAHAVFDVTPTWTSSAPMFFVLLGAAASPPPAGRGCRIRGGVVLAGLGLATLLPAGLAGRNGVWLEAALSEASAEMETAAATYELSPFRAKSALAQTRVPLAGALERWPEDARLRRAVGRLTLQIADASRQRNELDAAVRIARQGTEVAPLEPGRWIALAGTIEAVGARLGEDRTGEVIEALERAMTLDPRNLQAASRLAELEAGRGGSEAARGWAARALEIDAGFRLDPLKRLPEPARGRMDSLARPGPG